MSLKTVVDHVLVGAGIVGSCVAWQLQKHGKSVLLLEKFLLPHTRGSSHGQSRMIRMFYAEEYFAAWMPESYKLWSELERESGTKLIQKCGVWCISSDKKFVGDTLANMKKYSNGKYRTATGAEFCEQWPTMRYPDNLEAVLDQTGGVIIANKALQAVQDLFRSRGGTISDGSEVQSVELNSDSVKVLTTDGRSIIAKSLIVCANAWTPEIFQKNHPELSARMKKCIQPTAVNVYYWKIKDNFKAEDFPSFIHEHIQEEGVPGNVYGLNSTEYPGMMKICFHGGVPCNADEREKTDFKDLDQKLKNYIKKHIPGLEPEPAIVEKCMYGLTPDENFIIDHLYEHKNVVLGCGFSGTGFKTAPIVAKVLCEMALGRKPSYDVPEFKLSRFADAS